MPNLHMGSNDPRVTHEEVQAGTVSQEEVEVREAQVLRVDVSQELVEIAIATVGPVGIPVDLSAFTDQDFGESYNRIWCLSV